MQRMLDSVRWYHEGFVPSKCVAVPKSNSFDESAHHEEDFSAAWRLDDYATETERYTVNSAFLGQFTRTMQERSSLETFMKRPSTRRNSMVQWFSRIEWPMYSSASRKQMSERTMVPSNPGHKGFKLDNNALAFLGEQLVVQWEGLELGERKSRFAVLCDNRDVTFLHTGFGFCGEGMVDVILVKHAHSRCFQFTIVSVGDCGAADGTIDLYISYQNLLAVVDQAQIQRLLYSMLDDLGQTSSRPDSTAALRTATLQVMTAYLLAHLAVYRVSCVDALVVDMVCFPGEEGAVECCRQAPPGLLTTRYSSHFIVQTIDEGYESPHGVNVASTLVQEDNDHKVAAMGPIGNENSSPQHVQDVVVEEDEVPSAKRVTRPEQKRGMLSRLLSAWFLSAGRSSKVVPTQDGGAGCGERNTVKRSGGRERAVTCQRCDSSTTLQTALTGTGASGVPSDPQGN